MTYVTNNENLIERKKKKKSDVKRWLDVFKSCTLSHHYYVII